MPQIELEHVTKTYAGLAGGVLEALSDLTLSVQRGEFLVLAGPSGSGKTTLLRLVAGLEEPTRGGVRIAGRPVSSIPARERPVGMVFQAPALFPDMTVWDNLAFGLKVRGFARSEIQARVSEAADVLGLAEYLRRKPGGLSGGERQRVALGRALVRRPDVLLLDEPLSALDPQLRVQLRGLVRDLHARIGGATIYVTHDHGEAMLLGDRLAILRAGILEQAGSPLEVYKHPATIFAAGFLGSRPINLFAGDLRTASGGFRFHEMSGAFDLALEAASVPTGESPRAVVLGIRPEHLCLAEPGEDRSGTGCPTITGRVKSAENTGPETYLTVLCAGVACAVRSGPGDRCAAGDQVKIQFDPSAIRFFDPVTGRNLASCS